MGDALEEAAALQLLHWQVFCYEASRLSDDADEVIYNLKIMIMHVHIIYGSSCHLLCIPDVVVAGRELSGDHFPPPSFPPFWFKFLARIQSLSLLSLPSRVPDHSHLIPSNLSRDLRNRREKYKTRDYLAIPAEIAQQTPLCGQLSPWFQTRCSHHTGMHVP